jgi:hypothetical protein
MTPEEERVIEAWRTAARELSIEVVAPFTIQVDGRRHECLAWIQYFGRARGMVIVGADQYSNHPNVAKDAMHEGFYFSALGLQAYGRFDRDWFVETLSDWGFFGPEEHRPEWLLPVSPWA